MPKQKYVVVDWGSWGVEVQNSSKIIVPDPLDVKKGDKCSLQGTDPATKRPMLFQGHVLAVFGEFIHLLYFSLHRFRIIEQCICLVNPPSFDFLALDFHIHVTVATNNEFENFNPVHE